MGVQIHEKGLKVIAMIFEARYEEGFRYLDHAGELLVRIKKQDPSWAVTAVGQQLARLTHSRHKLALNIGTEKLDVSVTEQLDLTQAEQQTRAMGDSAEAVLELAAHGHGAG